MATDYQDRLELLRSHANNSMLRGICHGIERECLRVTSNGRLAKTSHNESLGRALTHPYITTDYSEALLEFITPVHCRVDDTLTFLQQLHQFTWQNIDGELLWPGSMPPLLEGDENIPIAQYGSSNIGTMKSVYREGLWHRYGKPMQTIAGIHYNFSLPEAFWDVIGEDVEDADRVSVGYFGMIRNFRRYSWLLMYLFGASPVVHRSFFADDAEGVEKSGLEALDDDALYLPYATSLRMSDMGYSNDAQSSLSICYNTLDEYVDCLTKAIRTPYPPYETIGLKSGDKYLQLNTNVLQIENEYYSNIRPKRVTRSGEKPVTALRNEGVEYIEVRCLDINPFEPLGLSEQDAHFLDVFLLYCALQPSKPILEAECMEITGNFKRVVLEGRRPDLELQNAGQMLSMKKWGTQLLEEMLPIAQLLDEANESSLFAASIYGEQTKLEDVSLTPSAKVLSALQSGDMGYLEFMLSLSKQHADITYSEKLSAERTSYFEEIAGRSIEDQLVRESSDDRSFDEFLKEYMASEV
ncbi:glutamate--cysteine ligase [Endozoicomonas ascidiicola]|uniref:glutamate--cysteine ligase n=1 Tax=Endozoicomonas ascidiicola TaxID=1698521 RepID=UPI000AC34694|nr:glutamate--cysteine ligase [Endozoicomonas ascidiicola]